MKVDGDDVEAFELMARSPTFRLVVFLMALGGFILLAWIAGRVFG